MGGISILHMDKLRLYGGIYVLGQSYAAYGWDEGLIWIQDLGL